MKSYVVIGLGRFGAEIAVKLFECGEEVLAIDLDETLFPPEKAAPQPEYTTSGCYDPKLRELAEMARSASAVANDGEPKEN